DLDGTLVDSLPGIAASLNRSLAAHGLPHHSDLTVRSFVGDGLQTLIQRAVPENANPSLLESLTTYFKKDYELNWSTGTAAYPGVLHMLTELQNNGFEMGVLSNKVHSFTVAMTRAVFPSIHFAKILGQRDGAPHKPHPAGALRIANALGANAENCIIIGDSTIDLETAKNAGMKAIAVAWGYHDRARLQFAGASQIIEKPSELLRLIS
ncbi:MAG: HAD family hydrolase, partial [Gloeobacteraceae cyanobacterium ES-bin-144]|nr:HAD family hydrolase [Verrucomicrobiales bacterium]